MESKRFSEMNDKQKMLFKLTSDHIQDYMADQKLDNPEGLKQVFEVFVSLTLALKSALVLTGGNGNGKEK